MKPYVFYNKHISHMIFCILIFVVSGCTSGYSKFYVQRADDIQMTNLESLAEGKIPVIVKTSDIQNDFERYLAKNYLTIGESNFGIIPEKKG